MCGGSPTTLPEPVPNGRPSRIKARLPDQPSTIRRPASCPAPASPPPPFSDTNTRRHPAGARRTGRGGASRSCLPSPTAPRLARHRDQDALAAPKRPRDLGRDPGVRRRANGDRVAPASARPTTLSSSSATTRSLSRRWSESRTISLMTRGARPQQASCDRGGRSHSATSSRRSDPTRCGHERDIPRPWHRSRSPPRTQPRRSGSAWRREAPRRRARRSPTSSGTPRCSARAASARRAAGSSCSRRRTCSAPARSSCAARCTSSRGSASDARARRGGGQRRQPRAVAGLRRARARPARARSSCPRRPRWQGRRGARASAGPCTWAATRSTTASRSPASARRRPAPRSSTRSTTPT